MCCANESTLFKIVGQILQGHGSDLASLRFFRFLGVSSSKGSKSSEDSNGSTSMQTLENSLRLRRKAKELDYLNHALCSDYYLLRTRL